MRKADIESYTVPVAEAIELELYKESLSERLVNLAFDKRGVTGTLELFGKVCLQGDAFVVQFYRD